MNKHDGFPGGNLRNLVESATKRALDAGALAPIQTVCRHWVDRGVRFLVRVVQTKTEKPLPGATDYENPAKANPFLPYDPRLHVADISPRHVCVLNKYNVVAHHLLIITRQFEHQETPLTEADFAALWKCLAEYDSLGFYNSGTMAGASQPHKHLQMVPLPLADSVPPVPIEALLDSERRPLGQIVRLDQLPFGHQVIFWEDDPSRGVDAAAARSLDVYRQMLTRFDLKQIELPHLPPDERRINGAYNLLVTRRWMLMVRRRRECFHGISLNALAFAGALLVHAQDQYVHLIQSGPMAALQHTAMP